MKTKLSALVATLFLCLPTYSNYMKLDYSCLMEVESKPVLTLSELDDGNMSYPLPAPAIKVKGFGTPIRNRHFTNARGGADLYFPANAPVNPIKTAKVIETGHWFMGTMFVLTETTEGNLIRYGFLKDVNVFKGQEITPQMIIGKVAEERRNHPNLSRLRVEIFSGNLEGRLTEIKPCFNRRDDVVNPNQLLEELKELKFSK